MLLLAASLPSGGLSNAIDVDRWDRGDRLRRILYNNT
jgi:hypothetical protein